MRNGGSNRRTGQFQAVPRPAGLVLQRRSQAPGFLTWSSAPIAFLSAPGGHEEPGSIFQGHGGVHLPLVPALWGSVACTMPNCAWEHLRQGSRLSGTSWNDECACLDLNETESADTSVSLETEGMENSPFLPWKTMSFCFLVFFFSNCN